MMPNYEALVAQAERLRAYATEQMRADPLLFEGWHVAPAAFITSDGAALTGHSHLVVRHPLSSADVLVQDSASWDDLVARYDDLVEQLIDQDQEEQTVRRTDQ